MTKRRRDLITRMQIYKTRIIAGTFFDSAELARLTIDVLIELLGGKS